MFPLSSYGAPKRYFSPRTLSYISWTAVCVALGLAIYDFMARFGPDSPPENVLTISIGLYVALLFLPFALYFGRRVRLHDQVIRLVGKLASVRFLSGEVRYKRVLALENGIRITVVAIIDEGRVKHEVTVQEPECDGKDVFEFSGDGRIFLNLLSARSLEVRALLYLLVTYGEKSRTLESS